jgi:hypothetical protein
MKRHDLKDVPAEVDSCKKMIENGWNAIAYVAEDGSIIEVDLTKKTNSGLAGASYMLCEWTPRALKKIAEEINAKRIKA